MKMVFSCDKSGVKLKDYIIAKGIEMDFPCGGEGRCKKCRVRFINGAPKPTNADEQVFSQKELDEGFRLACKAQINKPCKVEIITSQELSEDERTINSTGTIYDETAESAHFKGYAVSIDLGTTTIAAALLGAGSDGASGSYKEIVKKTILNGQKKYGADVISRIKEASDGKEKQLRRIVLSDLFDLIVSLVLPLDKKISELSYVVIAGNTTMMHLLLGDSCEGLGSAPYSPVRLSYDEMGLRDVFSDSFIPEHDEKLFKELLSVPCKLFPGISAFVGGDIVAGMYALSFDRIADDKKIMLIDLGTNGEMALADKNGIKVCSTAAGPVFEGGEISCGMAGVKGAIEHVYINKYKEAEYSVIGGNNEEGIGICGSGVLEIVSELRRNRLIDETGLLTDEYFYDGFEVGKIRFTQNDIRQVQLAKAAIRSGIEVLLKEMGISAKDVDKVYLAGGFSMHISPEKLSFLSIFPKEFLRDGVIECVGNSSLLGCEKYMMAKALREIPDERIKNITGKSCEIELASADQFNDFYIEAMNFDI